MFAPLLFCSLALASAPKDAGIAIVDERLPLAISVQTPEDLAYKSAAERQYLLLNLLVTGKTAWDQGHWDVAATKWESLLRTPGLPADVEAVVRAYAATARQRAGGQGAPAPAMSLESAAVTITPTEPEPAKPATILLTVQGLVSGGGSHGPGGAVVVLRRTDGRTPKPRAARVRAVVQKDKRFMPHVLAVPLGATVEFRNEDEFFHNVFSITKTSEFDLGLYKSGAQREQVFKTAGPVQLLCNIHAAMNGWLYVSDSPYFTQADGSGRFAIKGVPPGSYEAEVWHEWAATPTKQPVTVTAELGEVRLNVDGDRLVPAFVPDKAGKPRQPQLGY